MKRAAALLTVLAAALAVPAAALEPLPAVVHVHSDLSAGDFSLEQLAGMAERQGVGALLVTENYLLRVEYGLPPFRALTRAVHQERSVLDAGVDHFLARVAQARASNPRVLIVAGVEVLPHYFWSGSPPTLDTTVHDTPQNLPVFGLDPAARRAPPVTHKPRPGRRRPRNGGIAPGGLVSRARVAPRGARPARARGQPTRRWRCRRSGRRVPASRASPSRRRGARAGSP